MRCLGRNRSREYNTFLSERARALGANTLVRAKPSSRHLCPFGRCLPALSAHCAFGRRSSLRARISVCLGALLNRWIVPHTGMCVLALGARQNMLTRRAAEPWARPTAENNFKKPTRSKHTIHKQNSKQNTIIVGQRVRRSPNQQQKQRNNNSNKTNTANDTDRRLGWPWQPTVAG